MAWINCGLDHCGLDQGVKVVPCPYTNKHRARHLRCPLAWVYYYFRWIHGLDQLWLGSLWFGYRGESLQWMTASRNTILCYGLDQDMKCCQGLEEIITSFRIHGLDQLWLGSLWFGSGVKIVKGWPLRGTLFSVVVWIKTWNVVKG